MSSKAKSMVVRRIISFNITYFSLAYYILIYFDIV